MDKKENQGINPYLRKLAFASVIVFIGVVLSKLLSYVYRFIIARVYGPEVYGNLTLLMAVMGIFVVFAALGIFEGVQRQVPQYLAKKNYSSINYLLSFTKKATIISSLISAIIFYFLAPYLAHEIFKNDGFAPILRLFSLVIPMWALTNIYLATLSSFERIGWHSFLSDILPNILRVGFLLFLVYLGASSTSVYIFTYGLSIILIWIISYFVSRHFISKIILESKRDENEEKAIRSVLWLYALPLLFSAAAIKITGWVDSLSIGYLMSPMEVGFYNAALPIAMLLSSIPELFGPLFFPLINKLYSLGKNKDLAQLSKQATKWILAITLPVTLTLILFSDRLITLFFGNQFLIAASSLKILAGGVFLFNLSNVCQKLLLMKGKSKIILVNNIVFLLFNLFLNFLLIPEYGISGAAIATSITFGAIGITQFIQSYKYVKIFPIRRTMLGIVISSGLSFIIFYPLIKFIPSSNIYTIIAILAFGLIYSLLIVLTKSMDRYDKAILKIFFKKLRISR